MAFGGSGFTMQNQFWCYMDGDGYLIAQDMGGGFCKIGVGIQKYNQLEKGANEALEKAEKYFKMLEEHGLIERELTADERMAALSTQVDTLTQLVQQQAQMINQFMERQDKPAKPSAITPEILPNEKITGDNYGDRFIAAGGHSQALVAQ